jgi:hypothetical protein
MRREHIEVLYYAFILEGERLSELTRGRLLRTFHRNADRATVAREEMQFFFIPLSANSFFSRQPAWEGPQLKPKLQVLLNGAPSRISQHV